MKKGGKRLDQAAPPPERGGTLSGITSRENGVYPRRKAITSINIIAIININKSIFIGIF